MEIETTRDGIHVEALLGSHGWNVQGKGTKYAEIKRLMISTNGKMLIDVEPESPLRITETSQGRVPGMIFDEARRLSDERWAQWEEPVETETV